MIYRKDFEYKNLTEEQIIEKMMIDAENNMEYCEMGEEYSKIVLGFSAGHKQKMVPDAINKIAERYRKEGGWEVTVFDEPNSSFSYIVLSTIPYAEIKRRENKEH